MSLTLGEKLKVRSMIHVAAEPVPFFWPMRSFIHHNPLHGLEDLPFDKATEKGSEIFHARAFLPRSSYQAYLAENRVDQAKIDTLLEDFIEQEDLPGAIDGLAWCRQLLYQEQTPLSKSDPLLSASKIQAALTGEAPPEVEVDLEDLRKGLHDQLLGERPLGEAIDDLFGSKITADLNELVVKSCLDFYDEGQSVWKMPMREQGFFNAWKKLAQRNIRFTLLGLRFQNILEADGTAEGTIIHVLRTLGIEQEHWAGYFTRELAQLHGWSGFIRWREQAKDYHFSKIFPGDLVDFVAVRMTLALALIQAHGRRGLASTVGEIEDMINDRTEDAFLRCEFHKRKVLPTMAHKLDVAISRSNDDLIRITFAEYTKSKSIELAKQQALRLRKLARAIDQEEQLAALDVPDLEKLLKVLAKVERQEGMFWLRGMEQYAMQQLGKQLNLAPAPKRDERPFAQALFCIDTRSERLRRNLESIGDYQTFGIAGFFGVPVSFIELGKGSETHLCPVILTPKNVVLEITTDTLSEEQDTLTTLDKALHGLKESVVSPFVTVEAIGLLFGLEMIGKTLAPKGYSKWRNKLINSEKPETLLLLDKLDKEQAESILQTVQRALIIKGVKHELHLAADQISDEIVQGLRETAMGLNDHTSSLATLLKIEPARLDALIKHLREDYRINREFADGQMDQLGRIGFTLDEQANFVATALSAIGLTENFARFVIITGHGSFTDNNPYESALDCGACGGNHGLVSARVIAQMANRAQVRSRVRKMGITIPEDVCFIPALHNTTTDEVKLHDLDRIPPSHLFYLDWLRKGLTGASHLAAQERLPSLSETHAETAIDAFHIAQRNSTDWSQVRPEWGLSRNCYFIIGRRELTRHHSLDGRSFLQSYDYRIDPKRRLLESILTGPLVVGQWINMEHYFSAVDNEQFGSGSKVYHNVAGKFGVMTGNQSDLRTGLPAQTVLRNGKPFHQPVRLMTLIEAPIEHAQLAIEAVSSVRNLVRNEWIRMMVIDPETGMIHTYEAGHWEAKPLDVSHSETAKTQVV
ncbi:DUF2309 domain-containing protein [bacterium]|nr:DUF2309 domain-containing protein [Akkermansiaceae bacterium]MDB4422879.1 DUF2309 domain-containing protein [bacterium]